LIRVKETAESFRTISQVIQLLRAKPRSSRLSSRARTALVSNRLAACILRRKHFRYGGWLSCVFSFFFYPLNPTPAAIAAGLVGGGALNSSTTWVDSQGTEVNFIQAVVQPIRGKFSSMESLISHFRTTSEGWPTNPGFTYQTVESPKGEVGVTLVSNGTSKPTRLKLRTPVSHNMHLIPTVSVGSIFADFVATFCSLDIVLGEIDR